MEAPSAPLWIPVTESNKLLDSCSDRTAALRDLDDLIARGGVKVWATGVTSLHRNQAGSSRQPSGPVQPVTWAAIRGSAHEPAMWATGVATLPATSMATGLVLKGIRLERAPFLRLLDEYAVVAALLPTVSAEPVVPNDNRAPGGQRKWKGWDRVWGAIVTLALDERLNRAEFPSHAKLMDEIREIAGDDVFSDRILKPFLSKFYKDFIQPRG